MICRANTSTIQTVFQDAVCPLTAFHNVVLFAELQCSLYTAISVKVDTKHTGGDITAMRLHVPLPVNATPLVPFNNVELGRFAKILQACHVVCQDKKSGWCKVHVSPASSVLSGSCR
jgi:hypothetical protein